MSTSKGFRVEDEISLHEEAYTILSKIKNGGIIINPKMSSDFEDAKTLEYDLQWYSVIGEMGDDLTNRATHEVVRAYNGLLSRGAISTNINIAEYEKLKKENHEIKAKLEMEKKLHHEADGRLAEYRRRYEDGYNDESFVGDITDV